LFGPGPERTQTNLTGLRRGGIEVSNIRTTTLLERSHEHGTTLKEVHSSRDSEGMTGTRVSISVSGKFQLEEKISCHGPRTAWDGVSKKKWSSL